MARIFTASSSGVLIDNEAIEGIQAIDYKITRSQTDIGALGTHERVGVYYGLTTVQGRILVASASARLDGLITSGASFQVVANLAHRDTTRTVAFDECFMEGKDFSMGTGGHGETVYSFTAIRVREEDSGGDA